MGEDIIDMDLNMEGGRKETDEEGKEIAAGTDRSASEQTAPYEAEAAGTEQHIEDDEEIPQLIMEHSGEESGKIRSIQHLDGMYQKWFLDYASYVILERAVPYVNDGLKPVQRRILHSMRELDDGRYNKVANIIGNTMKYHPHGDASCSSLVSPVPAGTAAVASSASLRPSSSATFASPPLMFSTTAS